MISFNAILDSIDVSSEVNNLVQTLIESTKNRKTTWQPYLDLQSLGFIHNDHSNEFFSIANNMGLGEVISFSTSESYFYNWGEGDGSIYLTKWSFGKRTKEQIGFEKEAILLFLRPYLSQESWNLSARYEQEDKDLQRLHALVKNSVSYNVLSFGNELRDLTDKVMQKKAELESPD